MKTKLGINGFGRIGRLALRGAIQNSAIEVVAINSSAGVDTLAHLLKYDSTHGILPSEVTTQDGDLVIKNKVIKVLSDRDPAQVPWDTLGVEIVLESTGFFNDGKQAAAHLKPGVRKVIITAPAKNEDITIVMGVNEENYDPARHHIISNASCTTNCLAPVAKVLLDNFGICRGFMTTVHSYTNDQQTLDKTHKDLRRARAAGSSIIPTSTGAARALSLVIPELAGKMNGFSLRVPTPNVSLIDLVIEMEKNATVEEINAALKAAAEGRMKGILGYSEEPLVSVDYNDNANSATVDSLLTLVVDGTMAKVIAWYDNEWAYALRVLDLAAYVAKKGW
jgi:glyceraldehyde 3-phosphate dehydrogenase